MYGFDIARSRADDLDKILLKSIDSEKSTRIIDIACGQGGQTKRLAAAGALVTAIDIFDFSKEFTEDINVHFIQASAVNVHSILANNSYEVATAQRFLHYLRYKDAKTFLENLHKIVSGKLFISVTGIDSDIGKCILDREIEIENRFQILPEASKALFAIYEPVCLYSQLEFAALLEDTGWVIEKLWSSAFGNHKAICTNLNTW